MNANQSFSQADIDRLSKLSRLFDKLLAVDEVRLRFLEKPMKISKSQSEAFVSNTKQLIEIIDEIIREMPWIKEFVKNNEEAIEKVTGEALLKVPLSESDKKMIQERLKATGGTSHIIQAAERFLSFNMPPLKTQLEQESVIVRNLGTPGTVNFPWTCAFLVFLLGIAISEVNLPAYIAIMIRMQVMTCWDKLREFFP
jgi:hypothetical protein